MINRLFKFFSSLRLTVVLLGCALVLVFVGTLAQVKFGLYEVQSEFFRNVFVYWHPKGASWKIPILPGGWLLGGMLLLNLIAAHVKRFKFTKKKIGIFTIHAGLIFLLLGQFFTEVFQVESNIRFEEGQTRNYSEDSRRTELAIIDASSPDHNVVYAIPEKVLEKTGEIHDAKLPFAIRVKSYFQNSAPAGPVSPGGQKISASDDSGKPMWFSETALATAMDTRNVPSALVQFDLGNNKFSDDKIASLWIDEPQTIESGGKKYEFVLRPTRYYKPYSITLIDFRHDVYQGTDIPKNFSSKIHLSDPRRGEERDVVIKMNEPLRYAGETFFQAGFDEKNDKVTILQDVKNPAAITPYLACALVGLGLLIQFLMHLVNFGRRNKTKPVSASTKSSRRPAEAVAGKGGNVR